MPERTEAKEKLLLIITVAVSSFAVIACWILPWVPDIKVMRPLAEPAKIDFLIGLLGLISVTICFDQWQNIRIVRDQFSEYKLQTESLRSLILSVSPAVFVEGHDNAFRTTLRDIGRAQRFIKATANSFTGPAPPFWTDAVRNALLESKARGGDLEYEVKMFVDFANTTTEWCDFIEGRIRKTYGGLDDRVTFSVHDARSFNGLDILNVDGEHIHIRFSGNPAKRSDTGFALAVSDTPRFGSAVAKWYDSLGAGVTIAELRKRCAGRGQ